MALVPCPSCSSQVSTEAHACPSCGALTALGRAQADAQQIKPPARTAHGLGYWLLIGWWWGPAKWLGRVLLWVGFFPLGIWRSIRHGQDKRDGRARRAYR